VAPISFVAKREVGRWPLVAQLARLQRTVFVDRAGAGRAPLAVDEIAARLSRGDAIVLFAEGTSSDGNRVLPFRTSLLGAVLPGRRSGGAIPSDTAVQTLAIVYTHLHGLPLGRADRPAIGWYGDMEMTSHAWELLKAGPLDVRIRIGPPLPLDGFADRKALARHAEDAIRADVVALLRDPDH
jgi:1-acyl-sn-glycerol-3-phosphate acyltransferase